jgi:hypothetical protein
VGAYNIVLVPWEDAKSGRKLTLRVQFKFGDTWQFEYRVGDRIRWGGNDIGPRDAKYVVVDGALEGDPPEDVSEDFEIYIEDSVIKRVLPASGQHDFAKLGKTFIVLDDRSTR